MTETVKPTPEAIRQARADNPKMRERDLAQQLQISEADLVAAWCGINVIRISPRIETFLTEIQSLGEVMALTRNESAVHEKIGVYDKPIVGKHASLLLGEQIDMRLFPNAWAHGFAVEKHGWRNSPPQPAILRCRRRSDPQDPFASGIQPRRL